MPPISPVVKNLLIINGLMFFGTMYVFEVYDNLFAVYYPGSNYFRPFQLVTHLFMHGDLNHLIFNMFGLYMFGSSLEVVWGPKRWFTFYFLTGFGAVALHLFIMYLEFQGLNSAQYQHAMANPYMNLRGASGAVFGVLAGYGMSFPNRQIMLLIPPIPMKAKYLVIGYGVLQIYFILTNSQQGVAHFAHLGGAIVGAFLVYFWRKQGKI